MLGCGMYSLTIMLHSVYIYALRTIVSDSASHSAMADYPSAAVAWVSSPLALQHRLWLHNLNPSVGCWNSQLVLMLSLSYSCLCLIVVSHYKERCHLLCLPVI